MATPNPERELQRLEHEAQKGLPRSVLLLGSSAYFRTVAFDRLLAMQPGTVELRIVDGDQPSEGQELMLLRGTSLFSQRAFLAVRRADSWLKKHAAELERALVRGFPHATLLLETQKLDGRTKLSKLLAQHGKVYEFR